METIVQVMWSDAPRHLFDVLTRLAIVVEDIPEFYRNVRHVRITGDPGPTASVGYCHNSRGYDEWQLDCIIDLVMSLDPLETLEVVQPLVQPHWRTLRDTAAFRARVAEARQQMSPVKVSWIRDAKHLMPCTEGVSTDVEDANGSGKQSTQDGEDGDGKGDK